MHPHSESPSESEDLIAVSCSFEVKMEATTDAVEQMICFCEKSGL
jgi:hypothetical protein